MRRSAGSLAAAFEAWLRQAHFRKQVMDVPGPPLGMTGVGGGALLREYGGMGLSARAKG